MKTKLFLTILTLIGITTIIDAENFVDKLYQVDVPVVSRSISFENPTGEKGVGGKAASTLGIGRKGAPSKFIFPGTTQLLCNIKGPGVIRHIWMTTTPNPDKLEGLVIRAYWDGQKHPSIEVPFGEFFGIMHGKPKEQAYQSAVHAVNNQAGVSIYLPMPFAKNAKITIANEGPEPSVCYYSIDYTAGDKVEKDSGRLHVLYRRENPTTLKKDFEIMPLRKGKGRLIGCVLGIRTLTNNWWGEGEFKVYLDGDKEFPTICGTGTEDFVGQSWGLQTKAYLYSGTTLQKDNYYSIYRWFIKDPIYWKKDIRATIQQIGVYGDIKGVPHFFERQDDWTTATFWYEPVPSAPLPKLPTYKERIKNL